MNDGSVSLSCKTTLMLGLIQPRTRLDYLPLKASLIMTSAVHPKKTKKPCMFRSKKCLLKPLPKYGCSNTNSQSRSPQLITSKHQILHECPDVFEGIGTFRGPSYHIQIDPSIAPKQTPCHQIPVHLKEVFKQEINPDVTGSSSCTSK